MIVATRYRCLRCRNPVADVPLGECPRCSLRSARLEQLLAGVRPERPCPAPPGSPLKLAYLVARARARMPLWHPEDA